MDTARIDEVAAGIYRISTPVPPSAFAGGFSFNQYLVVDDDALLMHTGSRALFAGVKAAIAKVLAPEKLRYVAFSHHEGDEDGALNEFLALAPKAVPVCSRVNAMINGDGMDRPPKALADGETLHLGKHVVKWIDAPHLPHGWETGYLFEETTRTLLCGDLFTQPGTGDRATTDSDILGPSEEFRTKGMDYYAHGRAGGAIFERVAALGPRTLACMHGSAWTGDGGKLLRELSASLARGAPQR